MKTVTVSASKKYDICIGSGLMNQLGSLAQKLGKAKKVCLVSESTVFPLYGATAADSLKGAGFTVVSFVFPAGEESKNAQTYLSLLNFLADNRLTRSDLIVALGGGVAGDLAGFAAATYLRGIPVIQVPTTLLAMVDSSVGGKTAIDLPIGKNLVGAFHQPSLVLCDPDVLNTLPEETFRDGCAEVIKTAILFDSSLFSHLREHGTDFDREYVITRCVECKRDVVCQDEFDTGERQKLNLGHTIGHAVEALSGYTIPHGQAVAIGTAIMSRAFCPQKEEILSVLQKFGLPTATDFLPEDLASAALSDKKRLGDSVTIVVPERIGSCCLKKIPVSELLTVIKAGYKPWN